MEDTLEKYRLEQAKLIKEITEDRLTCKEAQERCEKLFQLLPAIIILNPQTLNELMKSKFQNNPDWSYGKIYYV